MPSTNRQSSSPSFSLLLSLPFELRLEVYNYALYTDHTLHAPEPIHPRSPHILSPLLLASRALYHETHPVFYTLNTFSFRPLSNTVPFPIPLPDLSHIAHLEFIFEMNDPGLRHRSPDPAFDLIADTLQGITAAISDHPLSSTPPPPPPHRAPPPPPTRSRKLKSLALRLPAIEGSRFDTRSVMHALAALVTRTQSPPSSPPSRGGGQRTPRLELQLLCYPLLYVAGYGVVMPCGSDARTAERVLRDVGGGRRWWRREAMWVGWKMEFRAVMGGE